jgi:hypothetical protein
MATGYRVQTRYEGGVWRTVRTWTDETAAKEDARLLAAERRQIDGVKRHGVTLSIPVHPYVRLMHEQKVAVAFGPGREA